VPGLARLFPHARLQGKGLIATEGFVSLPLVGREGAALAIRSHFFEFIPTPGPQHPTSDLPPRLAHELEPGVQYSVVITTGGGLYRYQLHDIVEVAGHLGDCPLLRFVGKEDYFSDWFGEKLNESHVRQAMDELFARYAIHPTFAMLACDKQGEDLGAIPAYAEYRTANTSPLKIDSFAYTLFIEAETVSAETLQQLGCDLEAALRENYHYNYCRDLRQLGAVRVFRVERGALETYLSVCQAHGQRAGDIKPVALHRSGGWSQLFQGRLI
jgi:hypothetical protein